MKPHLYLNFKADYGYGDFISNLAYCHNAVVKYDTSVDATFHWKYDAHKPHSKDDPESIISRFYYILNDFNTEGDCKIHTRVNSLVDYRYINNLDYQNPIHSYYQVNRHLTDKNYILIWRSTFNTFFPGYHKDPIYDDWDNLIDYLTMRGYTVKEVTYRTPINKVIRLISQCSMGIGYDGLIHQLFKCYHKPLLVFCKKYKLNEYLVPHAALENNFDSFKLNGLEYYRHISNEKYDIIIKQYNEWIYDIQDPSDHPLYNKKVKGK